MTDEQNHDALSSSHQDPLVGTTIQDRYRVVKKLGQGGMGAVYFAEHMLIQKKVAIKCLHAGLASNADVVRRFHNEAVSATAIGHPNIVDVTDMGRFDDGTFFMALEFLDGRDWQHDLDDSGAQPLSKVAHIGMQICDALEAASLKGIVHRDLKPENIFLIERHGDRDFVKVLDFGISKFHDGIGGSTRTGELMGTPYYMAPEQVRGDKNLSHVADIYALGVIFFQALTGDVPFDGNTLPELILKIASQEAPRLDEKLGEMPQPIIDLVARMLSKSAHDRPQTFEEVALVLANYLDDDSRLIGSMGTHKGFNETAVGGSADEPSAGEPVPERGRSATPVGPRGPDTSAGGTPGAFGRTELPEADHGTTTSPHSITNHRVSPASPAPATQTSSSNKLALVVAAVAVLGIGGWLLSQRTSNSPEAPTGAGVDENLVTVRISTLPFDADLFLDGEPISNPFNGVMEKDGEVHDLVAKREGFIDKPQKLRLNGEQTVLIQMKTDAPPVTATQVSEVEDPPKIAPTVKPRPRPAPTPAPTPAPERPAPVVVPAPAPAPPPAPAPASDLKPIF